jgi:hypothetical protein
MFSSQFTHNTIRTKSTKTFCAKMQGFISFIILSMIQSVQLKRRPYFNMSNLFTKIYNMLYYTTNLYLQ